MPTAEISWNWPSLKIDHRQRVVRDMLHHFYSVWASLKPLNRVIHGVYTRTRKVITLKTKWLYETRVDPNYNSQNYEKDQRLMWNQTQIKLNQLQIRLWIWRKRIICIRIWEDFWNQRKLLPNPATNRKYRNRRLGTKTFLEVTSVRGKKSTIYRCSDQNLITIRTLVQFYPGNYPGKDTMKNIIELKESNWNI